MERKPLTTPYDGDLCMQASGCDWKTGLSVQVAAFLVGWQLSSKSYSFSGSVFCATEAFL